MLILDPETVALEFERATQGGGKVVAIFVSAQILAMLPKLPVTENQRSLAPNPDTIYLGAPVYLDLSMPPGHFRMVTDPHAAADQLFMLTYQLASADVVARGPMLRRS